ncbi:MAG: cell wall-binding repeat-containing protein [Actinobacteria bacterium]|nr:cell wall-binding repeat-containing protein [Actinomycetota bacterium]
MTITIGRQAGAFASTLALTALGLAVAGPASAADADTLRLGGDDRYATSAKISEETFESGVDVAYLASGVDYPDALAGGAVAGRDGAPVLLTKSDSIPAIIAAELDRLNPKDIVILGGESAVSASVVTAADQYTGGEVERVSGDDRYATAAALAEANFDSGVDVVYVASGQDFPDALGGAAAAAKLGGPVLLTKTDSLPAQTELTLNKLNPDHIVVLGGEKAVSKDVYDALAAYDEDIERLAGSDRYATSAAISADTFMSADVVFIANGLAFPDALSGAPAAAEADAPILLVKSDSVSQAVCDEVNRLQPTDVVALGGTAAVSEAVLKTVSETCLADASINASVTNAVTESDDEVDFNEGDEVTYTVTVTNTSAVTLSDVAVAGTVGSAFELPEDTENVLAPGASLTFTATYTITAEDMDESIVTNTITATGTAPDATVVSKAVVSTWNPAEG